ncbi:hemerythrin domain-containing protein [Pseudomonas typographi]|uniref:Hemerythrin domain-containing protein n=1 Tax=Pseudomonas typographi TaxID=2715964 RepID=A0ABR7Z5T0_9PSED|nr:hemerythrin domain-containing protein [Pseudomonas typographi]MBD1554702.1 hemerythrin domain-containing protein [Pseudomonas typographi]MBD1589773.1 hemerythrin domain-containing protein [Pseudomonas typographi]MBD1600871.1 hemerythrin domain-containing protein [Pseudomonas typographi]
MNIFEALRESHDRQREMADAVIQTIGNSPDRVSRFKALKDELHAHSIAEERHFYIPLMSDDNGVDLSRHAIAEHHEMDELIEKLEEADLSSPGWLPLAKSLKETVLHHLKEEEQKFFQMAGKILSDKDKTSLAKKYQAEYEKLLADGS